MPMPRAARRPGVLDLQGSLSRGDAGRVHRYLPLILPDTVRHYVRDAVTQGALSDVKFRLKGKLNDMPFTDPKLGEFRVSAKVAKATLDYVPRSAQPRDASAWPALSELDGELVFPDGRAVAWREWQPWREQRVDRILVKRLQGVVMERALEPC